MSENKESIFKKIDTFLFKQVDVFKASAVYAKIQEPMSLMDDEVRLYVNNSIAILFIIIPLFFIGFFLYLNLNLRAENKVKKENHIHLFYFEIINSLRFTEYSILFGE